MNYNSSCFLKHGVPSWYATIVSERMTKWGGELLWWPSRAHHRAAVSTPGNYLWCYSSQFVIASRDR